MIYFSLHASSTSEPSSMSFEFSNTLVDCY